MPFIQWPSKSWESWEVSCMLQGSLHSLWSPGQHQQSPMLTSWWAHGLPQPLSSKRNDGSRDYSSPVFRWCWRCSFSLWEKGPHKNECPSWQLASGWLLMPTCSALPALLQPTVPHGSIVQGSSEEERDWHQWTFMFPEFPISPNIQPSLSRRKDG